MPPQKKRLPINLLRQQQREQRHSNVAVSKKKKTKKTLRRFKKRKDFECSELDALVQATEQELRKILTQTELLSDIPHDCTPDELLGELALAKGHATTVYVLRDGLSTLTVVLPQKKPTIANLKRAIESTARVQLQRELRERHENRLKRRGAEAATTTAMVSTTTTTTAAETGKHSGSADTKEQQQEPVDSSATSLEPIRSTGELVYSTTRCGHPHRPNVSWRFLWRAYALFNVDTKEPLNDENGRKLLSECGIENASTLKFCNRDRYFKRRRQ